MIGVDDSVVDDNVIYNIVIGPATGSDSRYNNLNSINMELININIDPYIAPTTGDISIYNFGETYVDMETDGGNWLLVAYADEGNLWGRINK